MIHFQPILHRVMQNNKKNISGYVHLKMTRIFDGRWASKSSKLKEKALPWISLFHFF